MKKMYIINGFIKDSLVIKRYYNKEKALKVYNKLYKSFNKRLQCGVVEYLFENGELISYKNIY